MAIAVNANISSGDLASPAGATITITKPTGTTSTDILIVVFGNDGLNGTPSIPTPPTGWTSINTAIRGTNASANICLSSFWALGSVTNLGFTDSNTADSTGWICVGFTGVDNTTPIDALGTANTVNNSATITANAVTVVTSNAWHLIPTINWNSGANEFSATAFTSKQNAGLNTIAALLYNTTPKSTGSTGTVVITSAHGSANSQVIAAMPFALRPAAGAAIVVKNGLMLMGVGR